MTDDVKDELSVMQAENNALVSNQFYCYDFFYE